MSDEEQTVVDQADTESKTSGEADDAQGDDLDSLLAEWDQDQEQQTKESTSGGQSDSGKSESQELPSDVREVVDYVKEQRDRDIAERTNRDIADAAEKLREGWEDAPPAALLEGEIWKSAGKDQRFLQAFQQRHQQPEKWDRILKAKQREVKSLLEQKPDSEATADREAVTAAVRSASKAPASPEGPSAEDISKMTDAEFERYKRQLRGA